MTNRGDRVKMAGAAEYDGTVVHVGNTGCTVEWDGGYEMFYTFDEIEVVDA